MKKKVGIAGGAIALILAGAIGYYSSQRDNAEIGGTVWHSQCFTESCYIALQINGVDENPNELAEIKDTTMLELVQELHGKKYQFHWFAYEDALIYYLNGNKETGDAEKYVKYKENVTFEEIKSELEKGYAVITSIYMPYQNRKDLFPNKRSGHIFVIIGYDKKGFYVNDPYGDLNTKYENTDGAGVFIDYKLARKFLKPNAKQNKVRVLFIHADFKLEVK